MSRILQAAAVALALTSAWASAAEQLTVVKDPETGQLRAPTAAEAEALKQASARQRASSRSTGRIGGVETRHADGSVEMSLGDDSVMSSVAVRQPDGSIRMECLPAAQAEKLVRNPKAATAARAPAHHHAQQPQKDAAGHDLY